MLVSPASDSLLPQPSHSPDLPKCKYTKANLQIYLATTTTTITIFTATSCAVESPLLHHFLILAPAAFGLALSICLTHIEQHTMLLK